MSEILKKVFLIIINFIHSILNIKVKRMTKPQFIEVNSKITSMN